MTDTLKIAGKEYQSRLLVGTGKYKDMDETREAIETSGAEIITEDNAPLLYLGVFVLDLAIAWLLARSEARRLAERVPLNQKKSDEIRERITRRSRVAR